MTGRTTTATFSGGKVQITVRDKALRRTEVFYCALPVLSNGMRYFQPLIQKQLDELAAQGKAKDPDEVQVSLKVNCSTEIFRWLLAYLKNESPKFTYANAVSVVLSSHFLRMDDLTDTALEYVRDNLADVLVSGVDMDCVPGELLGRFCTITREHHVAAALLELYNRGEEDHAGRSFLSTVARHLAMIRLSGKTISSTKRRWDQSMANKGQDQIAVNLGSSTTTALDKNDKMALDNGLRWCRLCGNLYDSAGIQRLLLGGKCLEPPCEALTNHVELRMGPRGEVYTTHVASDVPVSVTPPSTWDAPKIERWAWQSIGSILLVICTVCHQPCSLIESISHKCPNAQFTTEEPGFGNAEMDVILRWLQLYIEEREQQGEPNYLIPLKASKNESSSLEAESIVMPRYRTTKQGKGDGVAGVSSPTDKTVAFTWQGQLNKVMEVALGYDAGIDVDLLSYYERTMMSQLLQARAEEAPQSPPPRRHLSISGQNGQPLSYCHPSEDSGSYPKDRGLSSAGKAPLRQKQAFASTIGSAATASLSPRMGLSGPRKAGTYNSGRSDATFPGDYLKRTARIGR